MKLDGIILDNQCIRKRRSTRSMSGDQRNKKRIITGLIILFLYAFAFPFLIQVANAGTNSKFYLTIGTQGGYGLLVDSVTLSNPNPTPGESITATVAWRATACPTCIVKANAFWDWNKQEIARFHDGSNTGGTETFTFTAPGSSGNYNLRLIWAYDIGAFSDYDSTNLPSPSQASAWGNSASGILDVPFSVGGSSTNIKVTSPNGGEVWKIGSTYDITWTSQNIPGNVEIRIDRPGLSQRIAYSAPNTGKYAWTIGNDVEPRNDWRVVVTWYNPNGADVWDTSDQPFTITPVMATPAPTTPVTITPTPTPQTTGSIIVSSTPSSAAIYLDGSYQGKTPYTVTDVTPSYHLVELRLNGYKDWSDTIEVKVGSTSYVSVPLLPIPTTTATPTYILTPTPIQIGKSASVNIHSEKTDVVLGDDILLKLSAVNLITKPKMYVQIIIIPPSGMSVTSSEFSKSGAGQFTSNYELNPGDGRDIEVRIKSNQVGDFNVNGRIVYYFGDEKDKAEDYTLNQPVKVRKEPVDSAQNPIANPAQKSIPGFGSLLAVAAILAGFFIKRELKT